MVLFKVNDGVVIYDTSTNSKKPHYSQSEKSGHCRQSCRLLFFNFQSCLFCVFMVLR